MDEEASNEDNIPDSLSGHSDHDEFLTEDDIEKLIKDSLKSQLSGSLKLRRRSDVEAALVNTLSEFMDNFIILGYDLNHKAIEPIFYARNDMGADALTQYLQSYFIAMMKDSRR